MLKCEICNFSSKTFRGLSSHIVQKHGIDKHKYYDMYFKKSNEGICPTCGKPTRFISMSRGYLDHCSTKCSSLDQNVQIKLEDTSKIRYGYRCAVQSELVKAKTKQTFQDHFGVDNPAKSNIIKNKIKTTSIDRYGGIGWASKELLEKYQQTCLTLYGAKNGQGGSGLAKTKQTNQERFGTDCVFSSPIIRTKIVNTARKNGTMSKIEKYLEDYLNVLGIKFIREFYSDVYPYFCDFYLPELDMYIELNVFWMHGGHWFDKNNKNDIILLNKWKDKATKNNTYKNAIDIWTCIDIEKYETAKKNKLNYIVLWNLDDINDFLTLFNKNIVIGVKN